MSYGITLADSLGIEQAFKPNIKRWTEYAFERTAYKKSMAFKTRIKFKSNFRLRSKNNIIPVIELIKARLEDFKKLLISSLSRSP